MAKYDEDDIERSLKEENVYSDSAREELIDSDGISAEEEGFMKGYDDDMNSDDNIIEDEDSDEEEF